MVACIEEKTELKNDKHYTFLKQTSKNRVTINFVMFGNVKEFKLDALVSFSF